MQQAVHQRSERSGSRQAGTHASASASGTAAREAHAPHVSKVLKLRRPGDDMHIGSMQGCKAFGAASFNVWDRPGVW